MSLNDLLKTLQLEYLNDLPARIENIKSHISNKDTSSLVEDFHKLKGTGKTYGIPEISVLGEKMEEILLKRPDQGLACATSALSLLVDIHSTRLKGSEFPIDSDPRFHQII